MPRYLAPSAPPQERQPTPPPTPLQRNDGEPISQAWDPSSVLPGESSGTGPGPIPSAPKPGKDKLHQLPMLGLQPSIGEWLLDSRLVGKKLDVRILGTRQTSFHRGRYENNCGFIMLQKVPDNVNHSTLVRIGFEESQRSFPIKYLHPQTTTERPPFVADKDVGPISSRIGQRVVIIGPDVGKNTELVGNYGHIVDSGHVLPVGLALVQVYGSGNVYGKWGYFNEESLCRSHQETEVIPRG